MAITMTCCSPAMAQTGPAGATAPDQAAPPNDDIVVTASRRGAENIQDIPFNISALGATALAQTSAVDVNDVMRLVPGVTVSGDTGNKNIIIRGLAGLGEVPQVSIYLDEALMPAIGGTNVRQSDIGLFDLERVEVLRGPQGTLYGGGSQAGTIRYITNKPELDAVSGALNGRIGARSRDGGMRVQGDAMLNLPLVSDMLGIRLVGYARHTDGFVRIPALGKRHTDDEDTTGGRAELLFKPAPDTRILLTGVYQKLKLANTTAVRPDQDTRTNPVLEPFEDEVKQGNITIEQDVGFGTLTGSYTHIRRDSYFSFDQSNFVLAFGGANPPSRSATINQPSRSDSDVAELRFVSDFGGPIDFIGGLFYENRDLQSVTNGYFQNTATGLPNPALGFFFNSLDGSQVRNRAGFVNATWNITDAWSLEAGIRFYELKRIRDNTLLSDLYLGSRPGARPTQRSKSSDNVKKAQLTWKPDDAILVYGLYSEGFREGGPNSARVADLAPTFEPDVVKNFELGWKTTLFDRQLTFNGAAYYMKWDNFQVTRLFLNAINYLVNAGGADLKGVEAEGRFRPQALSGLTVNFAARYSEQKLTSDFINPQPSDQAKKGDALPYSSKFAANLGVQQSFHLGRYNAFARADASYTGAAYTTYSVVSPLRRRLGDYTLVNLRVGIDEPTWSLALYGSNVTDERKFTTWRVEGLPGVEDRVVTTTPREVGLEVGFKF